MCSASTRRDLESSVRSDAEMMKPGQANFIPRDSLLQFMKDYGQVALRVAEQFVSKLLHGV
jgi:hypothetical protein